MKAFARLKDEIWCTDLALVDKLAKETFGVKFLLVHQDLFDRTVDTKWMKTKESKETLRTFSTMFKKEMSQNIKLLESIKSLFFNAQGVQIYSTRIRPKLQLLNGQYDLHKNILYCYIENYEYKYIHKLLLFVTTFNSR